MCSTHNEGKAVIAEGFIRILKKNNKYMTWMSKIVYIDNLYDIVNKYNNTNHITIKMKVTDVKPSTYIDSTKEINDKDPKFKTGDVIEISKQKIIFAKDYVSNFFEETFMIKKVKNNMTVCSCHVTYAFQSESTLYSCLNVLELLARSRCKISSCSHLSLYILSVNIRY